MSIISKFISFIDKKNEIKHTEITDIFTKHGLFQAKMYKHNHQEYLAIMNKNFFDVDVPIFYIHADKHECKALDEFCGCSYPIGVALKMIHKDGGLILYASHDTKDIDALLQEVNTKRLKSQHKVMTGTNVKSALKGYKGEYLAIDFILKDLQLSKIRLVSDNPNILFIIKQRGIKIINKASAISFAYGDSQPNNQNEILEAINAINFQYPESK